VELALKNMEYKAMDDTVVKKGNWTVAFFAAYFFVRKESLIELASKCMFDRKNSKQQRNKSPCIKPLFLIR
jgi:hypothetical protein